MLAINQELLQDEIAACSRMLLVEIKEASCVSGMITHALIGVS